MSKNSYSKEVADTILSQLLETTSQSVIFSWGLRSVGYGYVSICHETETQSPCLVLSVSGLLHTGIVTVAYNEGADTYSIAKMDSCGHLIGEWVHGVYFDEMGSIIDAMVERDPCLSDDEYYKLAMADSDKKCETI